MIAKISLFEGQDIGDGARETMEPHFIVGKNELSTKEPIGNALTLLLSVRPKLYAILAFLSAIGLTGYVWL